MKPEDLSIQSVTKQPATKKLYNADGVWTGALRTLAESVALGVDNKPRLIPAGTVLWPGTSSGMDGARYPPARGWRAHRHQVSDSGQERSVANQYTRGEEDEHG